MLGRIVGHVAAYALFLGDSACNKGSDPGVTLAEGCLDEVLVYEREEVEQHSILVLEPVGVGVVELVGDSAVAECKQGDMQAVEPERI